MHFASARGIQSYFIGGRQNTATQWSGRGYELILWKTECTSLYEYHDKQGLEICSPIYGPTSPEAYHNLTQVYKLLPFKLL